VALGPGFREDAVFQKLILSPVLMSVMTPLKLFTPPVIMTTHHVSHSVYKTISVSGASPRSMSAARGRCEYGMFLYTASMIFSFTWVMVSQFSTLTGISRLFSLSGFTQLSVWEIQDRERERRGGVRERAGEREVLLARKVLSLITTCSCRRAVPPERDLDPEM